MHCIQYILFYRRWATAWVSFQRTGEYWKYYQVDDQWMEIRYQELLRGKAFNGTWRRPKPDAELYERTHLFAAPDGADWTLARDNFP